MRLMGHKGRMRCVSPVLVALVLAACKPPPSSPAHTLRKWDLLSTAEITHWKSAEMPESGKAEVRDGEALMESGGPMTGLRYDKWQRGGLPVRDYAITFEAMRAEGADFFAALTFPVRTIDTCATLVIGGWGGGLVGISSIDGEDAANNPTRSEQKFENGKWYRFKLEVRDEEIKAWIDDRLVINTSIKARVISLRPGYIESCAPFGLATYQSTGRVRNLVVEELGR